MPIPDFQSLMFPTLKALASDRGPGTSSPDVRHGVVVQTHVRYEIKRIDEDYFDHELF